MQDVGLRSFKKKKKKKKKNKITSEFVSTMKRVGDLTGKFEYIYELRK
jgi:hypothetical protein